MKLLVVDDSPEIVEILSSMMELIGHQVSKAYDGTEAVKLLHNNRYDVVITDAKMPIMDGIELCRFIKSQSAGVYVIGITGYPEAMKELKAAGADICLSKPFRIEEVEEAIEKRRPFLSGVGTTALQLII